MEPIKVGSTRQMDTRQSEAISTQPFPQGGTEG
jgi:hypothetical protein